MTANGPASDWPAEVIGFLSRTLPARGASEGWQDMALTAYQVGCMALVALGQADETAWGAVPRDNPRLPPVLPRWDDVCVAVLRLARQQNLLAYRLPDGGVPQRATGGDGFVVVRVDAPPPPAPNVAAAHGLGPARAAPEVLSVLGALGLVDRGAWTAAAETVLWRDQPKAWNLDVPSDLRFVEAVERALATMPDGVGAEMDRLVTITEEDVAAAVARSAAAHEEARARYGPKARIGGSPFTAERARRSLEFRRRNDLDWVFFRRWRLADGWLSPREADRALEVFHDRLAIAMRRAVMARRHPGLPFLAEQ
jgi:hypothetical protein